MNKYTDTDCADFQFNLNCNKPIRHKTYIIIKLILVQGRKIFYSSAELLLGDLSSIHYTHFGV